MKKSYLAPAAIIINVECATILAGSGGEEAKTFNGEHFDLITGNDVEVIEEGETDIPMVESKFTDWDEDW